MTKVAYCWFYVIGVVSHVGVRVSTRVSTVKHLQRLYSSNVGILAPNFSRYNVYLM